MNYKKEPVVILAGGKGTRITEETQHIPKPLINVGDKPIIKRVITHYISYGYKNFIILGGYKVDKLKEYFNSDELKDNVSIKVVNTDLETLTAGRLLQVKDLIGNSTFHLTYGDGVSDIDLDNLVKFHKKHGKIGTVTAVRLKERFGILKIGCYGTVLGFQEKCESKEYINGGFFVFEPEIFDYIKGDEMLEIQPLNKLSIDGELMAYKHDGFWRCIDTYKDKLELDKYYSEEKNENIR